MNAKDLLNEVCAWYNFEITESNDGITINNFDGYKRTFKTHEEALKDQLTTMKSSNQSIFETGDVDTLYNTWSKEEIEFIENL